MLEKSQSANQNTASIAEAMTNAEKVDLLSGFGMWKTAAVPAYGIKPIVMTSTLR